ncbi:hypothetical protein FOB72_11280 [Cupriavidus pauculus]|uniref:J domain-containing protein n=1 Tax=Cupriavidus pauculus TaxID=82633 RepID=A0A5P2H3H5_9BURK|nr:hypothetical protein [Cupriavidus pauculus]QET02561.1 hypothetical protein FOB72_11280 [Cupriavidus pauculus]
MDIAKIQTLGALEKLGSVDEIRRQLEPIVQPLRIDAKTYADLLLVVQTLQEKWLDFRPGPFVSRQAELVFYLTKLQGSARNELLGITEAHYRNKKLAKQWFRSISQQVHSDKGGDDVAFQVLRDLYTVMTEPVDEDDDA